MSASKLYRPAHGGYPTPPFVPRQPHVGPVQCRGIVRVPGQIHTTRCPRGAVRFGLCEHHAEG